MRLVEICLLIQFFQIIMRLQEFLILCFEIKNETLNSMGDFLPSNNKLLFQAKRTTMVLHQFKMFCNFKVLMMMKMSNKVKTISIVCYSNFIIHNMMIKRWVKHFQTNMKVVLQIMETL
jgi:hypothetical protein